jgi:hypothetical protein
MAAYSNQPATWHNQYARLRFMIWIQFPSAAAQLKREQAEGKARDRADLLSAGTLITAPGGHGTEYGVSIPSISSPEEAQAFVDARIGEGSDYIKIVYDDFKIYGLNIPTISKETMKAVIAAARKRAKLAVVHIGSQEAARDAIESERMGWSISSAIRRQPLIS